MPASPAVATCQVLTPEGISLVFPVATAGDRIAAFMLDLLVVIGLSAAVVLVSLPLFLLGAGEVGAVALGFLLVVLFLLRNFYFAISELRGGGTTIGKRRLGLRAIARDGGPLTADMIVARNLTRDLEFFLPLVVLVATETLFPEGSGWGAVGAIVWLLVFALLPLMGRNRLRCGDLIAGTIVVAEPASPLLPDVAGGRTPAASATPSAPEPAAAPQFAFTPAQLEVYGIHELQVLEEIFRKHDLGQAAPELLGEIAERIKKRIHWPADRWGIHPEPFLRAFYTAQRAHLERKLLFGQRKERKSER